MGAQPVPTVLADTDAPLVGRAVIVYRVADGTAVHWMTAPFGGTLAPAVGATGDIVADAT